MDVTQQVQQQLFRMQDLGYREFHSRLMPTVPREAVIGVRTPALRRFAVEFSKTPEAAEFMRRLPHRYYEENNLHAFLIERIGDYDATVAALDAFLPHVDNWATCDSMAPRVLGKHLTPLLQTLRVWLAADGVYTVRYAIGLLMRFYLDDGVFQPEYPALVAAVQSEEYYIKMMAAWYFATALAKQPQAILPFFTEHRLDVWTHNKAIQKAVESRRIRPEQKALLRTLRRK